MYEMYDFQTVVEGIKKLDEEDKLEVSLCLLYLLLPFQFRLEILKANPTKEETESLSSDFTSFLIQLRDGLLGGAVPPYTLRQSS